MEVNSVIAFDNYLGKDAMTKATVASKENVSYVNVNAYLYKKGTTDYEFSSNFMQNVQVATEDGAYTPAKYWPALDQVIDFVAWVPELASEKASNITVVGNELTFKVPSEATLQSDLLVANPVLQKNGAAETTKSSVALNFKHLLSRIAFQINGSQIPDDKITEVTLTELTLNGSFATEGTVTLTGETPAVKATEGKTTTAYALTGKHFGFENDVIKNGENATEDGNYLMIIPDANAPTHITIEYTVTTYDKAGEGRAPVGEPIVNTAHFALQPATGTFAYEAGKAYKYIFSITMDTISFDVEIEDWTTTENPEEVEDIVDDYTPAQGE